MEDDCGSESYSDTSQNVMEDIESIHDTAISAGSDLKSAMEEDKTASETLPYHSFDPETMPRMIIIRAPPTSSAEFGYNDTNSSKCPLMSPMLAKSDRRLMKKSKWKEQKSKSTCVDISYV